MPSHLNPKDLAQQLNNKTAFGLIPPVAKSAQARVQMLGAKKYGPYNWRDIPVKLTVYLDAAERHIDAIRRGEWVDPESGEPHAAHMACCANILMDAAFSKTLIDDLKCKDPK